MYPESGWRVISTLDVAWSSNPERSLARLAGQLEATPRPPEDDDRALDLRRGVFGDRLRIHREGGLLERLPEPVFGGHGARLPGTAPSAPVGAYTTRLRTRPKRPMRAEVVADNTKTLVPTSNHSIYIVR